MSVSRSFDALQRAYEAGLTAPRTPERIRVEREWGEVVRRSRFVWVGKIFYSWDRNTRELYRRDTSKRRPPRPKHHPTTGDYREPRRCRTPAWWQPEPKEVEW